MNLNRVLPVLVAGTVFALVAGACEPPGVGDPCVPEVRPPAGQAWAYGEVAVETRSLQCRTRTCMVYHFFPAGREIGEPDWRMCQRLPGGGLVPRCDTGNPATDYAPGCLARSDCPPDCCQWPAEGSPQEPCRNIKTEEFVRHFCKVRREGGTWVPLMDPPAGPESSHWYCDFDMSLINAAKPFCTLKCAGEGRTFECPEGYRCEEVVRLGPEGMRGSYCVPSRLVDCNPNRQGDQDCCQSW